MEGRRPVGNLSETIHSLLGLKAHLTTAWVKSVCNIVNNVPSDVSSQSTTKARNFQAKKSTQSSGDKEDDSSASMEAQNIRDELSSLTGYVNDLNIQRRQVLNDLLDLKGNIRVFCRVRPTRTEENFRSLKPVVASDSSNIILKLTDNKCKSYSFDKVFQPDSSQDEVFLEIEPVIKSVLDGYNACIFAYGQTGTGKTFTMEGTPESPGIVPRAIKTLFKFTEESNHQFLINFGMLEMYLGNLRDLLVPQAIRPTDPIPPCLSIHTDSKGEIEIENLVAIKVNDCHQALKLYRIGCRHRSTASTNSNSTSSRSHCMIRISITCFGASERHRETNKIWLVDLGGSERVLKTRASGKRLEEGKAINLSLSALGDVINALQRKKCHIPYRNSKLTQVLKDSLGQDSKTLMLVHISPKEDDLCETICSLNFAMRAKSIHLGQEELKEEREKKEAATMALQQTIEKIEEQRQRILGDIRKLNEKLEKLTGKPNSSEEYRREEIPCNPEIAKNNYGHTAIASSSGLPSFMRPTVSSKRKSGMDHSQTSDNLDILMRRRKPNLSARAESVSFPVKKKYSEYNSDRSISKSTCVMGLANADTVTVHSQDISECDIKLVVSENKRRLQMGSDQTKTNLMINNVARHGNLKTSKGKLSQVDNWLHSQKNNANVIYKKKRIMATPIPEKLHISKEPNTNKMLLEKKASADFKSAAEKIVRHEIVDWEEDVESEEMVTKPVMMLKDLFAVEARSKSSCSSQPDDEILSPMTNSDDEEEGGGSLYPPSTGYDGISLQLTDDDDECNLREEFSDRFKVDHSVSQFSSLQEADYSADSERDSLVSISMVEEGESRLQQLSKETGAEDIDQEQKNLINSSQQVLKPKSQKALLFTNSIVREVNEKEKEVDINRPSVKLQERSNEKVSAGKAHVLVQKTEALCYSALIGSGFLDVGFGNDFFYGLTK